MRKARFWPKINFNPIKTFPNWRESRSLIRTLIFDYRQAIYALYDFIKPVQDLQSLVYLAT